ncbi:MAG: mannitol-1-phosphate 5-dehydrogenase [Chthonomonadales bacterium]|nr:mannitol-1-phosphate 5-dehydrogenase [Chthonomonadales bacterium]
MTPTAVQFGAGSIGRGFIAQLFHDGGLEVVFVDVLEAFVSAINARRSYTIRIVGPSAEDIEIGGVRAVNGRDAGRVAEEVATCRVACTAVGAKALPQIAPTLAAGLLLRHRQGAEPLNILVCENLHSAGAVLRGLVGRHLPAGERDAVLAEAGFVQAVVSRMVPLREGDNASDPLLVRAEAYRRLPVDAAAVVGTLPDLPGVEPVADFPAHEARKLFVHNCAHAALGYLGWRRGILHGYEALADPAIHSEVMAVLAETGEALIRRFGLDRDEHRAHVADLLARFSNVALGDTCFRLARDPVRKLSPDDRLVGAARLCEQTGVAPNALARVVGAALRFDAAEDPVAVEMQRRIAAEGAPAVLRSVAGIAPDEPLGRAALAAYALLSAGAAG